MVLGRVKKEVIDNMDQSPALARLQQNDIVKCINAIGVDSELRLYDLYRITSIGLNVTVREYEGRDIDLKFNADRFIKASLDDLMTYDRKQDDEKRRERTAVAAKVAEPAIIQNPVKSTVEHPNHYNQGEIECIDALEACTAKMTGWKADLTFTTMKYLWRWPWKGKPVEDLEKAKFYIERMIKKAKEEYK
jgi:hypothetical protein